MTRGCGGVTLLACILLAFLSNASAQSPAAVSDKIAPWVRAQTADGGACSFIVVLDKQADTSGAAWLTTKEEKGRYVFDLLRQTAETSQGPLKKYLDERKIPYQAFWIINMITVERGDAALAADLAARDDVRSIEGNPIVFNRLPTPEEQAVQDQRLAATIDDLLAGRTPTAVAWGINNTNAPAVWSLGFTGQNIVVGGEDTGVYWQQGELQSKYRGWNGTSADHNYNWHDSVHSGGNAGNCTGPNMQAPCDDGAASGTYHGTHTMGTMVGGDGLAGPSANDYGMAYGAKWIACRNMDRGAGTPTLYIECHQWMLAPTNLAGNNPDPTKAPHVINNSWGCPASEGCPQGSNILLASIQNLVNAGIVYEASNGNDGTSGCGSVETATNAGPPAIYAKPWVFSTGAFSSTNALASFSSLGPVTINGSRVKPDIAAPGVSVLSAGCCTTTSTATMSGTSMAGPHVSGAVALLLSARPALAGQVERILYALEQTTNHDVTRNGQPTTCGGTNWSSYPSNFYGWGRLNIQAAVNSVCTAAQMATPAAPSLTAGSTSISLSWPAVTGATDYEVWRADASASCRPMYQVVPTTGGAASYNNTGLTTGTQYSYYILAKNGTTCTTVAGACATANTCITPGTPTLTSATGTCSGINLAWTAGTGTTNAYNVYRSSNTSCPAGTLTKLNGTPIPAGTLSYSDTTAAAGTTYTYVVRGACDSTGYSESANSNCLSGSRLAPPDAPTGVNASNNRTSDVQVSWTGSVGATGYNVLRGSVCGTPLATFTGVTTPYNDSTAAAGTTYQYWVAAVNACGSSAGSSCAAGRRLAAPPPVNNSLRLSKGTGDTLNVTYDKDTCSAQKLIILYGDLGYWNGYVECAQPDGGSGGSTTINSAGQTLTWYNAVWTSGTTAGHPGFSSSGARNWTAGTLCSMTTDDQTRATCP